MAAFINTNISSLNAQRNLNSSQGALATSLQRLSTGLRINSAKDDAAGLAISERMTSQIRGSDQAARNANDGISLAQTAEGDLTQIGNNLQRMRELAVQSANATNSASDRAALNSEVKALAEEIDRVAANSQFNGVNLLDGSFTAQTFQVGANATSNDQISIASISSARTSALGGVGTSYAAKTSGTATTGALAAGDLTLNGFQVGASTIGALPGQSAASASSIAKAINAVSSSSGVTATADVNNVTGGTISNFTAIAADTFSINGINVGAVAAGTNAAGQGANVAAAINKISNQTGVTATADAATGAIKLSAADGRDISIALNGTAATATAADANKTTFLAQTGLASGVVGTQGHEATTSVASGAYTQAASGTASDAFQLSIDGVTVSDRLVGQATAANLDTDIDAFLASAPGAGYTKSGSIAGGDLRITKSDGTALAIASSFSDAVGSTAAAAGATTGGTFAGAGFVGPTAAGTGTGTVAGVAADNHGTISLSGNSSSGIVWGGAAATKVGLAATGSESATVTSSVTSIASIDVLTAESAAKALKAIDGALESVSTSRAALGAYQNRFESVVSNLQTKSENLSASRSRIQDADFAKETASMTRGQILQQAGTAMLAQANSLPNGVLSLLRG
ncbi:flagellin N-terminal helical domain-containing protein [Noviherbaspirillum malthae]|uniref:flagellin N-terminal helical domain-containing protein n=1 Tax=Noviherbaspirillum malthae TaxID=1260987 RepID=UPI00188EE837|nr:flagellin [Noviherbaspirillum malthae]